jgi:pimeloyl-ACP methyl ester carboxylesterase
MSSPLRSELFGQVQPLLRRYNLPMRCVMVVLLTVLVSHASGGQLPSALTQAPPADKAYPAAMQSFQIPSHDGKLDALIYIAAGSAPHPTVVLLHGFPGNEKNLDLAQAIRRDGWNVLWFNYHGSWGSPGAFSLTHAIEATQTALAYLRDPVNATRLRVDPAFLVLGGHSMGGMISSIIGAHDHTLKGVALISAVNMPGRFLPALRNGNPDPDVAPLAHHLEVMGMYPLAGCTSESLARELTDHAVEWNLSAQATGLATHPLLAISSDDGLGPATDELVAKIHALKSRRRHYGCTSSHRSLVQRPPYRT